MKAPRRVFHHDRSEAGAATTEFVIIVPALVLLIMLVIQFALYYHAANVATAAAQDSVRAARIETGSAGAGQARAHELLSHAGGSVFSSVSVQTSRGGRSAHAEVDGTVVSVIPGLDLHVTRSADGPVEQFLPPSQR
jgi:Flp pilus assembly protein TadG